MCFRIEGQSRIVIRKVDSVTVFCDIGNFILFTCEIFIEIKTMQMIC